MGFQNVSHTLRSPTWLLSNNVTRWFGFQMVQTPNTLVNTLGGGGKTKNYPKLPVLKIIKNQMTIGIETGAK